jgi:hypothetical protein
MTRQQELAARSPNGLQTKHRTGHKTEHGQANHQTEKQKSSTDKKFKENKQMIEQ